MDKIYEFCANAERISANTENIENLKEKNIIINYETDEIKRTRYSKTLDCIFNLELNVKQGTSLLTEIEYMRTIEMFYPDVFSWRFNGKHIECMATIPMNKSHLGIFGRFRGIYGFIKVLRNRLLEILKMRDYENILITSSIDHMILSSGSINNETDLYVVDIDTNDNFNEILNKSNKRILTDTRLKDIDMTFWVKEINPDVVNSIKEQHKIKRPITASTFSEYPPCIQKISMQKKKGNYARFLLATFLLKLHNTRDAKHQLLTMLDDEERSHIVNGNCKDQWRAILVKNYASPSCKTMIEHGYCNGDCPRSHPTEQVEEQPKKTIEEV